MEVHGQPPGWPEVLAVFAARTAGAADGVDVAVLDPERVDRLRTVFWDMTKITTQVETIEHTGTREDGGWTESILHITITPRTPDDMRVFYQFTDDQNEALDELLENRDLLAALAGANPWFLAGMSYGEPFRRSRRRAAPPPEPTGPTGWIAVDLSIGYSTM